METTAKHNATAQDWTRLQTVIMRLYLDEDKTLEEVKSYMEEHHDFTTTYVGPTIGDQDEVADST